MQWLAFGRLLSQTKQLRFLLVFHVACAGGIGPFNFRGWSWCPQAPSAPKRGRGRPPQERGLQWCLEIFWGHVHSLPFLLKEQAMNLGALTSCMPAHPYLKPCCVQTNLIVVSTTWSRTSASRSRYNKFSNWRKWPTATPHSTHRERTECWGVTWKGEMVKTKGKTMRKLAVWACRFVRIEQNNEEVRYVWMLVPCL